MYRKQLLKTPMFHDINERKLINILTEFVILELLPISQKEIILAPQLFLRSEQRASHRWIHVDLVLVKHTVSFLLLDSFVAGQIAGSDVTQVVGIMVAVVVCGLLDFFVNVLLVAALEISERLLVLDL